MRFEIGRYYMHSGGRVIHIISAGKTTLYGWCLFAEEAGEGNFLPIGSDEVAATNWTEISESEWLDNRGSITEADKIREILR